jgi:hypothetical protein
MALADLGLAVALRAGELLGRFGLPGLPRVLGDLPDPQNDPGEVRRKADDILSRPEYREPPKTLLQRIQDAIGDFLGDLLSKVGFGSSGAASVLAWVVLAVLAAVVGLLVFWLVRAIVGDDWGSGRGAGGEGDPVILAVDEHRTPDEWLAEAERHEAEGRWREGLLCRYRSLVTRLVELEVIPEAVGRTAGEYVGDVAERHPAGAGDFRAATELFESAWYGGVDTGSEGRDRFVGLADAVLASAASARVEPPAPVGAVPDGGSA